MDWRALIDGTVVFTALFFSFVIQLLSIIPYVGIFLVVPVSLGLWRYGYSVLRSTAQNRRLIEPPSMDSFRLTSEWTLIGHFVAFPLLIAAIAIWFPLDSPSLSAATGYALVLLIAFAFPASAAVVGLTSDLPRALNPKVLSSVIRTFGRDYLTLCVAIAGLAVAVNAARWILSLALADFAALAQTFVDTWALLGVFALIGSSVREHGDDFLIPGAKTPEADYRAALREQAWLAALDEAYGSIRSDFVSEGYRKIEKLIDENGGGLDVQFWIFDAMLQWEDRTHAVRFGSRLIERLIECGDLPAALETYQRCRLQAVAGAAMSPEASSKLAELARSLGRHAIADELAARAAPGRSSTS